MGILFVSILGRAHVVSCLAPTQIVDNEESGKEVNRMDQELYRAPKEQKRWTGMWIHPQLTHPIMHQEEMVQGFVAAEQLILNLFRI
jgi:hypothetical protein